MIRALFRRLVQPLLWWAYRGYSSKKRWYSYDGLRICLYPSVFHPVWMLTTTTLLDYIGTLELKQRQVLELGAGNGLVALWCARAGATVTASDINPAAIRSIDESATTNQLALKTVRSDLFQNIPSQVFDFIFINPPYFPKAPNNEQEMAFFCGPNFEYFHRLFHQLGAYRQADSTVLMILTDDCDLAHITALAQSLHWQMEVISKRKKMGEWHFIFELSTEQV